MFYRPKPQITWLDAVKYNNFAYNKRNFFGKTAEKPCGKVGTLIVSESRLRKIISKSIRKVLYN